MVEKLTSKNKLFGAVWRRRYLLAYGAVALVALALRTFRLGQVPFGLHIDEAAMAYDALSVANYGVTRDLISLPVYAANYGGGQSVLYTYVLAALIKVFGFSYTLIRVPGVLFSLATLVCGTRLIRQGLGKKAALLGAALIAIMPYFITSARFGLDCYLLTGTSTVMLWLFCRAVEKQKTWLFSLAGLAGGVALYAYAVSYIILPVFFVLALAYLFYTKRLRPIQLVALGVPLFLLALPLMLFILVNHLGLPSIAVGPFTIPALPGYRGSEVSPLHIVNNLKTVAENIFFMDWLPYNAFNKYFTLFIPSIPFLCYGMGAGFMQLYREVKARQFSVTSVVYLFFASSVLLGLMLGPNGPNVNKINAVYYSCAYLLVLGICRAYKLFGRSRLFAVGLAAAYLACSLFFANFYFRVYPGLYYPQAFFCPTLQQVATAAEQANAEGGPIYYSNGNLSPYYGLEKQLSPYELQFKGGLAESYGEEVYFRLPSFEQGIPRGVYVVQNTETELMAQLEDGGCVRVYEGWYIVYRQPR